MPESQNRRMFLGRVADYLKIIVLARIAECLEIKQSRGFHCQSNMSFSVDDEKQNLPETLRWPATGIPRKKKGDFTSADFFPLLHFASQLTKRLKQEKRVIELRSSVFLSRRRNPHYPVTVQPAIIYNL